MQNALPNLNTKTVLLPQKPSLLNRKTIWGVVFALALALALSQTGILHKDLINEGGFEVAWRFVRALIKPDLSAEFLSLTLQATLTTLAFAVCGVFFSLLIGFTGGIIASETWWGSLFTQDKFTNQPLYRIPWLIIRSILAIFRAIHELIWALIFINFIGLDPLSAILAISIPFGAVIAKVFSEILDESDHSPLLALQSSGITPLKAFSYGLIPQALPDLVSYSFYRFECAIRAAAVLGIIGAGGLGYEIMLSFQTLKYEQIWTLLLALFLLNGSIDLWSALIRRRIGANRNCCHTSIDLEINQRQTPKLNRNGAPTGDLFVRSSMILGALLVPFSFLYVNPSLEKLYSSQTLSHLSNLAQSAFPPDFTTLPALEWFKLSGITLAMSLLAVSGAALFSLVLSFPAANNFLAPGGLLDSGHNGKIRRLTSSLVLFATRALLLVARSVPPPIWALILLFVLFPGILPGAAALGLYTLGVLGRLTAESVENLDERPLWALKAQGAGGAQVFSYGVLALTWPRFLGFVFYRWEESIRATVVVGLVGAGGLGRLLIERLSSFDYKQVMTILIVFIALTLLVDLTSAQARRAFRTP